MERTDVNIVFKNRHGSVVNRNSFVHEGHFYINYISAYRACEEHLNRCKEGAYVLINGQPKYSLQQMDSALRRFFNKS